MIKAKLICINNDYRLPHSMAVKLGDELNICDKDEIIVGRTDASDLKIGDGSIARRCCKFILSDNMILVEDLGSVHPVQINGESVLRKQLSTGDIIKIGLLSFRIDIQDN